MSGPIFKSVHDKKTEEHDAACLIFYLKLRNREWRTDFLTKEGFNIDDIESYGIGLESMIDGPFGKSFADIAMWVSVKKETRMHFFIFEIKPRAFSLGQLIRQLRCYDMSVPVGISRRSYMIETRCFAILPKSTAQYEVDAITQSGFTVFRIWEFDKKDDAA